MIMFLKFVLGSASIVLGLPIVDAHMIPIPGSNYNTIRSINEMAVKILSKNYADMKEVVVHGDSDPLAIEFIRESESFPMIIYNDASLTDDPAKLRLYHNSFIMTPRSLSELEKMLLTFKKSTRWNVMAPFIILNNSNGRCRNSRQMLKLVWTMDLIKTYFLCVDNKSKSMVFTFNPHTSRAPHEWQQVQTSSRQSSGWSMYRRQFDAENIGEGWDFDRTKHLDGSRKKLAIEPRDSTSLVPYKNYNESIYSQMWPKDIYFMERLKYFLNSTHIFRVGSNQEIFEYIADGTCDILVSYLVLRRYLATHPVVYAKYHIVTNNRSFYTPLEKIGNFFGMVTLISLCVILPMTFIVILLSGKIRRWSFAGFEIMRLLINAALHTRMDTIALRIFFSMIFLYFLILQAMFQGHLIEFLMKQEYRKNAETLNDLRDSRYKAIHIYWTVQELITDPVLREKLIPGDPNCIHEIIGNDSIACIFSLRTSRDIIFEHKLHVSKNPVLRVVNYLKIREDWPLRERFNIFLMILEDSGQSAGDWKRRPDERIRETHQWTTARTAPEEIHPIFMSMLNCIFIFLLIGLKLATIILGFERSTRNQTSLRRQNRRAARRNIMRRRRELLNKIFTDQNVNESSQPHSI